MENLCRVGFILSENVSKLRNKSVCWFIAHSVLAILYEDLFVSVGGTAPSTFPNANPFRLRLRITVMTTECSIARDKNQQTAKRLHKTKLMKMNKIVLFQNQTLRGDCSRRILFVDSSS